MHIDDEKISAFLDSELPEQEMDNIRDRIASDSAFADRVEALSQVDVALASNYSSIDTTPIPNAILDLIENSDQPSREEGDRAASNVVPFPQRAQRWLQQHAAVAASVAMVVGLIGGTQLVDKKESADHWSQVVASLESTPSGRIAEVSESMTLQPLLSFQNAEGAYCRHFVITDTAAGQATENIACKQGANWEQQASIAVSVTPNQQYQTASRNAVVEQLLDSIMATEPLTSNAEQKLIENAWQSHSSSTTGEPK